MGDMQLAPAGGQVMTAVSAVVDGRNRTASQVGEPEAASRLQMAPSAPSLALHVDLAAEVQRPSPDWVHRYQIRLGIVDATSAVLAYLIAMLLRFGSFSGALHDRQVVLLFSVGLPVLWVASLAFAGAYESRCIGTGTAEFQRVSVAFLRITALVTLGLYAAKFDISRGFMLLALVLTVVIDAGGRLAMRSVLRKWWLTGQGLTSLLAVGEPEAILRFASRLDDERQVGVRVVGACVPGGVKADPHSMARLAAAGVRVYGDISSVRQSVALADAHTVAVLPGVLDADQLRRVSWQLEGTDTNLIVSSGLTGMADRRLHIQPIGGMALVHVDGPRFTGTRRLVKGAFDRSMATLALVLLFPVLAVLAALVASDGGPVFFRQTRIGKDGVPFTMIKFRSMQIGSEFRVHELQELNDGAGLLFKVKDDPRVTPVGRVLRRFSLDELPQLVNVSKGSMSLVGPRPPLPSEFAEYGDDVRRRLLVKPGLTGVWQVSGRSNLSWDKSVGLDLSYVENWSLLLDLSVLLKTARAVFKGEGAY